MPERPLAPPVNSSRLAASPRIEATPTVIIRRVRSDPRRIRKLLAKPISPAAAAPARRAEDRIAGNLQREQPGGIGADAEEGGVTERQDAGMAENEIEREGEKAENGDVVDEQQPAREDERGGEGGEPERQLKGMRGGAAAEEIMRRRSAHRASPRRPCGRQSRIATITL